MRSSIEAARELGMDLTIASNMSGADKVRYEEDCRAYGIDAVHVDISRNPLSPRNAKAFKELVDLMMSGKYDIVHCNTPVGGLLGRLAAKRCGIKKVIYMAHGFHFWCGAPLPNWVLYYPVERALSSWSDWIVTINQEDYLLATRRMKAKRCALVPGVGVNVSCFTTTEPKEGVQLRDRLGIPRDSIFFLSVGELNKNKDHETALRALSKLDLSNWFYVICGEGEKLADLRRQASRLGIDKKVIFAGFQPEIQSFYSAADVFLFPSRREGLPSAVMEAMAAGLPVVGTRIRGLVDLLPKSSFLFEPGNEDELSRVIATCVGNPAMSEAEVERNTQRVREYSFEAAVRAIQAVYRSYLG